MTDPMQDREIERRRYDERAARLLDVADERIGPDGAEAIEIVLQRPYVVYEEFIRAVACPGVAVLDVCCGDGLHSLTAARAGAGVTVSDIAENNLRVVQMRARRSGVSVKTLIANSESVPLADASFDVITCAGSLSYVDLAKFLAESDRLLRPGGRFICVDSLNHNPIYRLNRYLHYIRGHRTKSVISRTPTLTTLHLLAAAFPVGMQVRFFGMFSWLSPVLNPCLGHIRTAALLNYLDDHAAAFQRYAFKFVFAGSKLGRATDSACSRQVISH